MGGVILVVEDEAVVRSTVARMLSSLGYVVHEAPDGETALSTAAHIEDLSLVLTDMKMPGMGGRQLASALEERHPDLPVMFMTGYSRHVLDDAEVLMKPFTSSTLSAAIQRKLDLAGSVKAS